MGTRNLTMVFYKDQFRVMQYGQWDGYPSGQGKTVLEFLTKTMNRDVFLDKLMKLKELTPKEVEAFWKKAGADNSGFVSMDIAENFKQTWLHLSRDCGADILKIIQDSPDGLGIYLDKVFPADSLFCEWAYLIDFDKNVLEVYRGFNNDPLPDGARFKYLEDKCEEPTHGENKYYPITFLHTYQLDALPVEEVFVKELSKMAYPDEDAA